MNRIIVSPVKPTEDDMAVWIDADRHTGRLMTRLMGDGDPIGIDLTDDGLTIIAPLPPPAAGMEMKAADGNDSKTGTDPDEGRITSRKTLYERFKTRLNENLDERKQ